MSEGPKTWNEVQRSIYDGDERTRREGAEREARRSAAAHQIAVEAEKMRSASNQPPGQAPVPIPGNQHAQVPIPPQPEAPGANQAVLADDTVQPVQVGPVIIDPDGTITPVETVKPVEGGVTSVTITKIGEAHVGGDLDEFRTWRQDVRSASDAVEDAYDALVDATEEMQEAKAKAKVARSEYDDAVLALRSAIRGEGERQRNLPYPDEEKPEDPASSTGDRSGVPDADGLDSSPPVAEGTLRVIPQDESWRTISLDTLQLRQPIQEALRDAGLLTVGDLADWSEKDKRLTDIKGIGDGYAEQIAQELDAMWERRAMQARAKRPIVVGADVAQR